MSYGNPMESIPFIRLEIGRMKNTVTALLQEHAAMIDADIRSALDEALTEKSIRDMIRREVHENINHAIKEEIQRQFQWTHAGRTAIREAVEQHFDELWPDTKKEHGD